jgi:beta-glucosidase
MAGEEVVQLYLRDEESSFRVPLHKLCGLKRISLEPGEQKTIAFTVDAEQMGVIDDRGELLYESGKFTLFAGGCQPDDQSQELTGSRCIKAEFEML